MSKYLEEYEQRKTDAQLKAWHYYTSAKSMLYRLQSNGIECDELLDSMKDKHYTFTFEEFKKVRDFFNLNT